MIFINQPKITVRMLSPHGRLLLSSNGACFGAIVHDGRAVIRHPLDQDDDERLKSLLLTLTIILTLLADSVGILIHVFDVLFQDFNMPEMGLGGSKNVLMGMKSNCRGEYHSFLDLLALASLLPVLTSPCLASPGCAAPPSHGRAHARGRP